MADAQRPTLYALLLFHLDHTGVDKMWGPFGSFDDASRAMSLLASYGLRGVWEVHALLPAVGVVWHMEMEAIHGAPGTAREYPVPKVIGEGWLNA